METNQINPATQTNSGDLWQAVLGEIEIQISRPNFLTWLKQSQLMGVEERDGVALVGLPNNFAKEWVKNRYHKLILGSLRNFNPSIKNVNYAVFHQNFSAPKNDGSAKKRDAGAQKPAPQLSLELKIDPKTNLNPKYTLDSFVVGASNELAYAAIQAVIKDVGKKYNPLFVYGGVGLGKTHLLQATGNEIQRFYNNAVSVLYVTSEKFLNDVVSSIRNKRMEDMKRKYRDVDVLIIDDIQFIGGKTSTEQEFFHTFNALYENNKQIIMSSDRAPAAIPTLEERLRSRFEGGMIADISYPDYEMRLAILKSKSQAQNLSVDDKTLEFIASRVQKNMRELEGVLNKVFFYMQYKGGGIDNKKLEEIINETIQISPKNITTQEVIRTVAEFFEVPVSDLIDRSRKKEVVEPRQIAMYLLRDILKLSFPHIGEKLGKRDHTTAIHACEKIAKDLSQSPQLGQKILLIKERLYKT
ncbi:MAG: chromosomal replication initiator protein DnaA [Candidatus Jorgensenbacteria bacterium GW2011_GWA2_45_13]|uniref:Chromosomal replication initiator protein DnaA n=1 Tax=Candidatus Jorgensenbacteria bacterium GW2011_GWA2_45_13 TaxID=1618662 RepID=A0A0G1L466_9BACT|nr:MAG: chromosomal replication initiator protein DnaA [Candidatus Jorgensenbacteria bacterium GW2011_GWA2_45_13]